MNPPPLSSFPDPVAAYLQLAFPDPRAERPHVILNMVSSADGKAVAGSDESALSSSTDKLVLQALRVHADAVLNGSGTARTTGINPSIHDERLRQWRTHLGRSTPPLQVLLTRTGAISPAAPFLRRSDFRLVIFVAGSPDWSRVDLLRASGASVESISGGELGIQELMQRLRTRYGVRLLLVEGGPTLNASLFHAEAIDEFFLTVGPHVVAGRDTMTTVAGEAFLPAAMPSLQLISARPNSETSEVYIHWRVRPRGG